jgi:hypothetical protein
MAIVILWFLRLMVLGHSNAAPLRSKDFTWNSLMVQSSNIINGGDFMSAVFPSEEWLKGLEVKLNSDEKYAGIAKNWEGDLFFSIDAGGNLKEGITFYLDLWHGKCRKAEYNPAPSAHPKPSSR